MEEDTVFEKLQSQSITSLYEALVYIRTNYLKQKNGARNFCRKGGIQIAIALAEKPKLSDVALSILANCCLLDEARKEVLKHNGITVLIRILRCLASESVQNRACRALSNLAVDTVCANAIHKGKAIPIIVNFLQNNKHPDCQHTAIRALRILGDTNEHRNDIVHHEGIFSIAELLSSENVSIKKCSVRAIAWLSQHCTAECAQQIQEAEGINALVNLSTDSESEVCEYALTSLTNLASQPAIRPVIGASGAIPVFITNIECQQYQNPDVNVIVTALCLCCQESVNRNRVRESGGLKTLMSLLKENKNSALSKQIISTLLAFRFEPLSLSILFENDLIATLIKHLNIYIKENRESHLLLPSKLQKEQSHTYAVNVDNVSQKHQQGAKHAEVLVDAVSSEETEKNLSLDIIKENSDDCNDSDADNEVASFNRTVQKSNSSSKVFCIYSPSYQEIQYENYESLEHGVADVYFGDVCSPGGSSSYCLSPDRHSMDCNIPSPPSPYGMWSPATSSRDTQWSPVLTAASFLLSFSPRKNVESSPVSAPSSPSSASSTSQSPLPTSEILRYSPVCEDHGSEEENNSGVEQLNSTFKNQTVNAEYTVQTEVASKQESHIECGKELERNNSKILKRNVDGFVLPSSSEKAKRRRMSASSDASTLSNSYKGDRQQHTVGDYILFHMSHISQLEKHIVKLATKECIEVLLNYISFIPSSSSRAERILCRLTSNCYAFEYLIAFGITVLLQRMLTGQHSLDVCDKCRHLDKFHSQLQQNLSVLAESRYGMGELSHLLLTGQSAEQSSCILAISHLVRRKKLLHYLLIDCYGLEILMELLRKQNHNFKEAVRGLSSLCCHFIHMSDPLLEQGDLDLQSETISAEGKRILCKYSSDFDNFDVHFIVNSGIKIGARKSQLAEQSTYFYTMFEGSFVESTRTSIPMPDVSEEALNTVLHHLYGCGNACISTLTDVLLEVITVADKLLLKDLENQAIKTVIYNLSPSMLCEAYLHSMKYGIIQLHEATMKYLLIGDMSTEERCSCISQIFSTVESAADDLEIFIRSRFPESKDRPLYKRPRIDSNNSDEL